jgi:transglutaminase-like putative cysteine protease
MRLVLIACIMLSILQTLPVHAIDTAEIIANARILREKGDFKGAANVLSTAANAKDTSDKQRQQLAFETDLLSRIRQDFSLTRQQLYLYLEKALRDFTKYEFEQWMKEGRFENRMIDGTEYFASTSISNLFWRDSSLDSRRKEPKDKSAVHRGMLENARVVKKAVAAEKKPYVLPHELEVTMTVTTKPGTVPAGEIIRAWLPIPRKYPFQGGFKLLSSSSPIKDLADETRPIRSAYMEQPAVSDGTKFQIKYRYSTHAIRFDLDPKKSQPLDASDDEVKQFTHESPHVAFNPEIKALAERLVGKEKNPVKQARAFYDWIGNNIKYSYALEYSTIPNISEYCRANRYGDCGQQALLFITLCRSKGIPARWQSGWILFPNGKNIHDWTEIYLKPWGWVPVDVEVGGAILQYARTLTVLERNEVHDFYFGGLDQYRMIANCDHSQELQPPKRSFRSDDVDFQRGELETDKGNLYFDKYSYKLDWQTVK